MCYAYGMTSNQDKKPTTNFIDKTTVVDLFEQLQTEPIPYPHRIFANRNLRMRKIQMIGFDMDYTLALYHSTIESLAVELTLKSLVENHGYPKEILQFEYEPDFAIRGLVIDKRLGNILKMNHHRHIVRAFHGLNPLSKQERLKMYRNERIRMSAQRYALVDTLFAVPEAWLFAKLISHFESKGKRRLGSDRYQRMYHDIRIAIDRVHADQSLKTRIRADLPHYIERDPRLGPTLHRLRSAGNRLFLMTNSYGPYSMEVMRYLLDEPNAEYPTWQHYFDIIVVGAKKPSFFTRDEPFLQLDDKGEPTADPVKSFERGVMYQGGNVRDFESWAGASGDQILYVGDHLYGDILRTKKDCQWRTLMIIPEMERELSLRESLTDRFSRRSELESHLSQLDSELQHQQVLMRSLDELIRDQDGAFSNPDIQAFDRGKDVTRSTIRRLQRAQKRCVAELTTLTGELETTFNNNWGMLFKAWDEHSVFGGQIEDYACIYSSRVSNLAHYSPWHYFRTPRDLLPHEHTSPELAD